MVKNPSANTGDVRDMDSIPVLIPWIVEPGGESHLWVRTELDTTEVT